MKKNKVATMLLIGMLAVSAVPTTVSAQEVPVESSSISSFNTILPVELTTDTKVTIYTGKRTPFISTRLVVTNSSTNSGNIVFQVVNQKGNVIGSSKTVKPGKTGSVLIPAVLGGTYEVQVWAESVDGDYYLAVNK